MIRKMSLVSSLVVSLCSLAVANNVTYASEHENDRCRQREFGRFSDWSAPVNLGSSINTEFNEFHSAISADELSIFFATNRPGGLGGLDLWVAQRPNRRASWRPAQNLGPTINSMGNEAGVALSPDGHWLFFCTNGRGGFGGFDVFASFRKDTSDDFGWQEPLNLGEGVNSEFDDCDPTLFEDPETRMLTMYFASLNRPQGPGDWDIYVSTQGEDGMFGPAVLVPELSSPQRDAHPTARCDGLEILLASNRPGTLGMIDLWISTRPTTHDVWSMPANLGPIVNTPDNERAPYLSADGQTLFFTSDRPDGFGDNDFYMTERDRLHHHNDHDTQE